MELGSFRFILLGRPSPHGSYSTIRKREKGKNNETKTENGLPEQRVTMLGKTMRGNRDSDLDRLGVLPYLAFAVENYLNLIYQRGMREFLPLGRTV